jgi:restriction system protein
MRPLLAILADDQDHENAEIRGRLADHFSLTQEDLEVQIPSGRAKKFANRVGWATTHLYQSGLIDRPRRSVYRIAPRGHTVLTEHPDRVDLQVLSQFDEYREFRGRTSAPSPAAEATEDSASEQTPEEQIDLAYRLLRTALAADVLDRVKEQSPAFFEQLVLDVLRAMGYGGSHEDAVQRLGRGGDEGVDGVIREDELGLDLIYVQAKRWQNPIGRPEIQKFFGALHGKRANKGVFITTSSFTGEAVAYADTVSPRIILVDGRELARLMIDYGVGVTSARNYDIKRIDLDYFATEDEATSGQAVARAIEVP